VSHFPLVTAQSLLSHIADRLEGCRRLLRAYHGVFSISIPEELQTLIDGVKMKKGASSQSARLTLDILADRMQDWLQDVASAAPGVGEVGGEDEKRGALTLALLGWEAFPLSKGSPTQSEGNIGRPRGDWVLKCGLCGRSIQASRIADRRGSFGRGRGSEGEGKEEQIPRVKARSVESPLGPLTFDAVSQHRWWCPWVSRGMDEKGMLGWRQALKAVVGRMRQVEDLGLLGLSEQEANMGKHNGLGLDDSLNSPSYSSMYSKVKCLMDSM